MWSVLSIISEFPIIESNNSFTLAGVHLTDSPNQTLLALKKQGYRLVTVKKSESYRQWLTNNRASQLGLPKPSASNLDVSSVNATLADQRITINFSDNSSGKRVVSRVSYVASDIAHPYNTVLGSLIKRQGRATTQRPQSAAWCVIEGDDCDAGGIPETDMIAVHASNEGFGRNITTIELQIGSLTKKKWANAHEADLRHSTKSPDAF